MPHAVHQPSVFPASGFEVHVVPAWEDNLVFLIADPETGEAAVVDAPDAAVVKYAEGQGLRVTAILNTHTHPDHIGINRALDKLGKLQEFRVYGCPERGVPGLTHPVDDGAVFALGRLEVRVLRTEGHQDGHLSFVVGDVLFCGDTLFTGGCGYLFDGPPAKMHASLQRLAALPGETRVCCAHEYTLDNLRFAWSVEPHNEALASRIRRVRAVLAAGRSAVPSTLAEERATNPFLRTDAPTLRARVAAAWAAEGRAVAMRTPEDVFAALRALKDLKRYRALTDADLPT